MLLLTLLACLDDLTGLFGVDEGQDPAVEAIVADCTEGELWVEAFVTGQEIAEVELTVSSTSDELHAMAPDYSWLGDEELWTTSVAVDCAEELELQVAVITSCDRAEGSTTLTPPTASSVVPSFGLNTGGIDIAIAVSGDGSDFQDAVVELGTDAAGWTAASEVTVDSDCSELGGSCLRALTPDQSVLFPDTSVVDLRITTDDLDQTLSAVFTLFPDNTGLAGGLGRVHLVAFDDAWMSYGSPYADVGDADEYLQLDLLFHEPTEEANSYLARDPVAGSCEWGSSDYDSLSVGSAVRLEGDAIGTVNVPASGNVYPYVVTGPVSTWEGAAIDLSVLEANEAGVPVQTLEEAFFVPTRLASSSWDDPSQEDFVSGTATQIRGDDILLTWQSVEDLDGLSYELKAVEGYDTLSSLSCGADPDLGALTVPWSELVDEEDQDAVDGILVFTNFYVDRRVEMHDGSHFWGRGALVLWSYLTVVD